MKLATITMSPATKRATIVKSTLIRGHGVHYDLVKALEQKDRYLEIKERAGKKSFMRKVKTTANLALRVDRSRRKFLPSLLKKRAKDEKVNAIKGKGKQKKFAGKNAKKVNKRQVKSRGRRKGVNEKSDAPEVDGPLNQRRKVGGEHRKEHQMKSKVPILGRANTQSPDMMKRYMLSINKTIAKDNSSTGL